MVCGPDHHSTHVRCGPDLGLYYAAIWVSSPLHKVFPWKTICGGVPRAQPPGVLDRIHLKDLFLEWAFPNAASPVIIKPRYSNPTHLRTPPSPSPHLFMLHAWTQNQCLCLPKTQSPADLKPSLTSLSQSHRPSRSQTCTHYVIRQ